MVPKVGRGKVESEVFYVNHYFFEFSDNYKDGDVDDVFNKRNLEEYEEVYAVKNLHGENLICQEKKLCDIHLCKIL